MKEALAHRLVEWLKHKRDWLSTTASRRSLSSRLLKGQKTTLLTYGNNGLRGLVSLLSLTLAFGLSLSNAHAASSQALMKAKKETEAKGYIFAINHEEIVAKARKEGRLRVLSRLETEDLKPMVEVFKKKYPFIGVRAEEIAGVDTFQRMILEMKSGAAKGWDVNFMAPDFYNHYLPYQKRFDVYGMVQHGVLTLPIEMVDPINRNIVAFLSISQVVAYNKKLISEDKVPIVWEDFLKPEFKGKNFSWTFVRKR